MFGVRCRIGGGTGHVGFSPLTRGIVISILENQVGGHGICNFEVLGRDNSIIRSTSVIYGNY